MDDIGIDYAVDYVSQFGFHKNTLPRSLSLALGTLTVSPLDLSIAYAAFANGGYKVEPFVIGNITDAEGKHLLTAKPRTACSNCNASQPTPATSAPRILSPEVAFLTNSALMEVIESGTGSQAKQLNRHDIAGKTGTTNEQIDGWFSGYNPSLVVTTG